MYAPAVHDESQTLVAYVDQQLQALRAAPYGLTEEQARSTPCRSALSVAGLLKHVTHGMRGAIRVLASDVPPPLDEAAFADYLAALADTDPEVERLAPPAPWNGISEAMPIRARYYLAHQVEEMARHAGHADILREQVDGTSVPTLVMTRAGVPANPFFQPYAPSPGTITT
ncbi:MAG TPA: DUF664 domain-containing protein [Ornithinibacter sp.]|nr:DUF664 domain-containing protein [Ornithinibacter sp.]